MHIVALLMGIIAIVVWVSSVQQKDLSKILISQALANFFYGLQYAFLNVWAAAPMNFLSFFRNLILFYYNERKMKPPVELLLVIIAILIILGLITYDGPLTLIPPVITLIYTISIWQNNLNIIRYFFIVAAIIWIYYNLMVGAYVAIAGNVLEIISGSVSLVRFTSDKKKKKKTKR